MFEQDYCNEKISAFDSVFHCVDFGDDGFVSVKFEFLDLYEKFFSETEHLDKTLKKQNRDAVSWFWFGYFLSYKNSEWNNKWINSEYEPAVDYEMGL